MLILSEFEALLKKYMSFRANDSESRNLVNTLRSLHSPLGSVEMTNITKPGITTGLCFMYIFANALLTSSLPLEQLLPLRLLRLLSFLHLLLLLPHRLQQFLP